MDWDRPKVYAVKHKNEETRAASQSGAVFTAISDWALENNGTIYGCVLDKDFKAGHVRTDIADGRNRMRGSKYVASSLGDVFGSVKADLSEGRKVLFTGTSCQIAGLKGFLQKDFGNLVCVDIVCHGVPSPRVWHAYLDWQMKRNGAEVRAVDFRNKRDFGWHGHIETLTFDNGKRVDSEVYRNLFYGHMALRPSCYECPYKSVLHPGDITIGDYWGIEKAAPEMDDNKGVSLVLINSQLGESVFEAVKNETVWKETRLEDSMQPPLTAPFQRPAGRERFWIEFDIKDFGYIARKYGGNSVTNQLKRILVKIKGKLVDR